MDFLSASFTKLWLPLFERVLRLLLLAAPLLPTVPALQLVVVPVLVTVAVLIVVAVVVALPGCC